MTDAEVRIRKAGPEDVPGIVELSGSPFQEDAGSNDRVSASSSRVTPRHNSRAAATRSARAALLPAFVEIRWITFFT